MKITLDTSSRTFQTFFTLALLAFSILLIGSAAYSWTSPAGTAPNNNVAAPINTSAISQAKSGPLQVNGFLNTGGTQLNGHVGIGIAPNGSWSLVVQNNTYGIYTDGQLRTDGSLCIGGSCITSWSAAGGVPAGAVMPFNLSSCPSGWSSFSAGAGRVIVGAGSLSGYSYSVGATGGSAYHSLTVAELPSFRLSFYTSRNNAGVNGQVMGTNYGYNDALGYTNYIGGNQAFDNRQAYVGLLYCQKN